MPGPSTLVMSLDERSYAYQYWVAIITSLSACICGIHFAWITCTLPKLLSAESPFPITTSEASTLAIMLNVGIVPGYITAWILCNKYGRKITLQISTLPFAVSSLTYATCADLNLFYMARFLAGFGISLVLTALPAYLSEISASTIRGNILSFLGFQMGFGGLLQYVLVPFISISMNGWIITVFPVILFIWLFWMPNSPYYTLMIGHECETQTLLRQLNRHERDFTTMKEQMNDTWRYSDLFFIRSNRKAMMVMLIVKLALVTSGSLAIGTYTLVLFKNVGSALVSAADAGIVVATMAVFGQMMCVMFLDNFPRKSMIIATSSVAIVALFGLGVFFFTQNFYVITNESVLLVPLVLMSVYRFAISMGTDTLTFVILGEIFPTNVKSFATCIISVVAAVPNAATVKVYQIIDDRLDVSYAFWLFMILHGFCLIVLYRLLPETKGKSLEDIQNSLRRVNK